MLLQIPIEDEDTLCTFSVLTQHPRAALCSLRAPDTGELDERCSGLLRAEQVRADDCRWRQAREHRGCTTRLRESGVIEGNVGLALESIPFNFAQPVDSLPNFAVGGE